MIKPKQGVDVLCFGFIIYKMKGCNDMETVTEELIEKFKIYLTMEEKSTLTTEKYVRDVTAFMRWLNGAEISKLKTIEYKQKLITEYAPASVNSMISSINSFFEYAGWSGCKVKTVKIQKQLFVNKEKELTDYEYKKLLIAAKNNTKLYLLLQTLCSTGIRISELRCITVEAIKNKQAIIKSKGKIRTVILPVKLCTALKKFASKHLIKSGSVFISKKGNPLDRSNVWKTLKSLCRTAGVSENKVFPHNLRHLFARTYYSLQKDVVRLADILGHSNINTTRIYTIETGEVHRAQIQKLGLLLC